MKDLSRQRCLILPAAIWLLLTILSLMAAPAQAGLFSTLSKVGKAVNKVDVDIPLNKLELPEGIKGGTPAAIKPGADGQWDITLADGTPTRIVDLLRGSTEGSSRPALVIRDTDLPRDIRQFDNFPDDWPVLVQGRGGRLFELHRGGDPTLAYGRIRLPVKSAKDIRNALWQLQRPSTGGAIRFLQLDKQADLSLPVNGYGSRVGVERVGADGLIDAMQAIRNQTLVLSGRIVDGKLLGVGNRSSGVSLQKLRQVTDENDIQLIILESDQPAAVLKKVSHAMQSAKGRGDTLYDTIGDFFNRLTDPANPTPIKLHSSRSGEHQIAIQLKAADTKSVEGASTAELALQVPLHLLLKSAIFHAPDQARSRELDDRIIPNVPSTIQFYIISSVVLGFFALNTSWRLWKRVWRLKPRREYRYLFLFLLLWPLHRLLFVLLFIPLFGNFSFIWLIVTSIYWVLDRILIRPVRWVYLRLSV